MFCENLFTVCRKSRFFGVFHHNSVRFVISCTQNFVNFLIFWKNHINCPSFWCILHIKMLKLCVFEENPKFLGSLCDFCSVFCILGSKYPNFLDSSPPNTDYSSQIIRFYQFFRVIDN